MRHFFPLVSPLLAVAVILSGVTSNFAQSPPDELSKLRQEVQQLREENQRLRQLLIDRKDATPAPYAPAPVRSAPAAPPSTPAAARPQGLTYWLTLSRNKRHNSTCRYYRASNGRPCGPNEGIPCKICGEQAM